MLRLSIEARRRIVSFYSCEYSIPSIVQQLEQENVEVSKHAIYWGNKFGIVNNHVLATRGGTRNVYVPRHEKSWTTQTCNGNNYRFIMVPHVFTHVKMKL